MCARNGPFGMVGPRGRECRQRGPGCSNTRVHESGGHGPSSHQLSATWSTRSEWLGEVLPPGDKDIIDLDRTGADHDRPLHRSGVETDVGEPARSIEGLSGVVIDGDVDANASEAARAGLAFGRSDEHLRDPTAAMAGGNLDVLEFGRIGESKVEVTHRLIAAPRNQVEPVALVEAREPVHWNPSYPSMTRPLHRSPAR